MLRVTKLTDLMLAAALQGDPAKPISAAGLPNETLAYMPPERTHGPGHPVDARTDIYTLGATMYALFPGHAPFPGDTVNIAAYIQATGYAGRFVDVELLRRTGEEPAGSGTSIASERIQVGADGEVVPVSFEVEPDAQGRFVYQIRAAAPPDDDNPRDNGRESEMDVVDRQTRVLLVASGPTRSSASPAPGRAPAHRRLRSSGRRVKASTSPHGGCPRL